LLTGGKGIVFPLLPVLASDGGAGMLKIVDTLYGGLSMRVLGMGLVVAMCVATVGTSLAVPGGEETPSAQAARKKLKQKISIDEKEIGFKAMLDAIKGEMEKPVSFKIDNMSGISNNSKVTYTGKDKTVEEVLNELADKFDFGWYVVSNAKDRNDGWVMVRKFKDKERGYESGKEPKK
jgi:hypothetical protein